MSSRVPDRTDDLRDFDASTRVNGRFVQHDGTKFVGADAVDSEAIDALAADLAAETAARIAADTALAGDIAGKANTVHTHAAGAIVSGIIDPARLGSGTASSSTVLYGDSVYRTVPAGYTDEMVDDRVAALLVEGSGIDLTYDDAANTLTIASTATGLAIGNAVTGGTAGSVLVIGTGGVLAQTTQLSVDRLTINGVHPGFSSIKSYIGLAGTEIPWSFYNSSGTADGRRWDCAVGANFLDFRIANDAYNSTVSWASVIRSGMSIVSTTFNAADCYFNTIHFSGLSSGGSPVLDAAGYWTIHGGSAVLDLGGTPGNDFRLLGDTGASDGKGLKLLAYDGFAGAWKTCLRILNRYAATPLVDIWSGIRLLEKSSTGTDRDVAHIDAIWYVNTDASRLGELVLSGSGYNGDHVGLRVRDNSSGAELIFENIRDAADDTAAAALSPPIPVNGVYRTGSALKVRVS